MSPSARWFVDLANLALQGISAQSQPAFSKFLEGAGDLEGLDVAFIQIAYIITPKLLTPEYLIERTPYARPDSFTEYLVEAVERGWLEKKSKGTYKLTKQGKEVVLELYKLAERIFANIRTLPEHNMEQILELLGKVIQAIKSLPEPAEKPAFEFGQRFDRGKAIPLLMQVRRGLIDLLGFRDDIHIAAWKPYTDDGQAWEALTLIWHEPAATAAELAEQLPYRAYDEAAYEAALHKLVKLSWVEETEGKYTATEEGARIRQEVEDTTDRLYDAPWAVLGETGMAELQSLLIDFAVAVTPPEEGAA
jgi:DNA-binding PadR family transcriptional regulator